MAKNKADRPKVRVRAIHPDARRSTFSDMHDYPPILRTVHVIKASRYTPISRLASIKKMVELGRGSTASEAWENALVTCLAEELTK